MVSSHAVYFHTGSLQQDRQLFGVQLRTNMALLKKHGNCWVGVVLEADGWQTPLSPAQHTSSHLTHSLELQRHSCYPTLAKQESVNNAQR
jgi:hypothetical protein